MKELKPNPLAGVDAFLAKLDRVLATPVSGDLLERVFPRDQLDLEIQDKWDKIPEASLGFFNPLSLHITLRDCPDPNNCEVHGNDPFPLYSAGLSDRDKELIKETHSTAEYFPLFNIGFFRYKRVVVDPSRPSMP